MDAPPPKPIRGVLRDKNPITIPKETGETPTSFRRNMETNFKGIDRRRMLIDALHTKLNIEKFDDTFNGLEGVEAAISVIMENSAQPHSRQEAKEKAIKLLDLWLQESIIRPHTDDWALEYQDNKKTFYQFNPPEMHRVVMTPRARSKSYERKPSRKGSFRSLFKFNTQENNDESRSILFVNQNDEETVENSRLLNRTKAIRMTSSTVIEDDLRDEAAVFDAALRCLLLEIDIPILDGVLTVKDCGSGESVSFLSSILRRMKLSVEHKVTNIDDVMNFLAEMPHLKRTSGLVINWFRAALLCAPGLYLEKKSSYSDHSQINDWVNHTRKTVNDYLSNITSNCKNPLIPNEFCSIILAVCEQLCRSSVEDKKRDRVLHYLWLMIPNKLRRHLSFALDYLQATANTNIVFDFNDPFFVDKLSPEYGNNFWTVVEDLRSYMVSQTVTKKHQVSIIELYLNLRQRKNLENIPAELKNSEQSSKNIFCHTEQETDVQAQQRIVDLVEGIIQSNAFTPQRKKQMIADCKKRHPQLMSTFFTDL